MFYTVTVYVHMHLWIGFATFDSSVYTSKYEIDRYVCSFVCSFHVSTIVNHFNYHDLQAYEPFVFRIIIIELINTTCKQCLSAITMFRHCSNCMSYHHTNMIINWNMMMVEWLRQWCTYEIMFTCRLSFYHLEYHVPGWWFGTCVFPYLGNLIIPMTNWLICFQRGGSTTIQLFHIILLYCYY